MKNNLNTIVILGGGSAGWLSAANFVNTFPNKKIILVESDTVPIIGVGESTTAMFKTFINIHLGIDDKDFMPGCDAIYKMSVKFKNFEKQKDNGFHYPFGIPEFTHTDPFYIESWNILKYYYPEYKDKDFAEYFFPAYHLFTNRKFNTNQTAEFDNFDPTKFIGYHLDANKLGSFLRDFYCIPRGVSHVLGDVQDITLNDQKIKSLHLQDGTEITGDLFIDCTGFKSVLLDKIYKPKWKDLSNKITNNRAWATPIRYKDVYKEMYPYTTSTALKNGWVWHTPIANRSGNGYVYSDKYTTSTQALNEFKKHLYEDHPTPLTKNEIDNLPFFELKMKAGYFEEGFSGNVIAIGLSAGFLEPLEGTQLFFITESLLFANKIIERGDINQFMRDSFNLQRRLMFEDWADVLNAFYTVTLREDSLYWNEIKNKKLLDTSGISLSTDKVSTTDLMSRYLHDHLYDRKRYDAFTAMSLGTGLSFLDTSTIRGWEHFDNVDYQNVAKKYKDILESRKEKWCNAAESSMHYVDFLKSNALLDNS